VLRRISWLFLFLLLLATAATASLWLPKIVAPLIRDDGPAKADVAVVLAGDQWGNRVLKGAELVRDGFVPAVVVSGPPFYAEHECDAAINFAVMRGYPREWFIPAPNDALSTREEARAMLDVLRRRAVRNFLLVTSDYHTARSARIYRAEEQRLGGGPAFRAVAAPDRFFRRDSWWRSREGLKTVFFEWSKTVATAFGM
jgi:uncharacterized SAM-binding protein YcdF (DUF218 family)